MSSNAYKAAGVDVEAGYEGVKKIKPLAQSTFIDGVISDLGSFGALFDLSQAGVHAMEQPVLVSGTDGVGTKLLLAIELGLHETIGIDCVAMCANDVLAQGAFPLFFLDYIALGKNDPQLVEKIVKGVVEGCLQAECALIGGETAEMPGVYATDHYDLAGFCVGAADKKNLISTDDVKAGDVLIGLASSGIHSNGYSLVRKIISDNKLDLSEKIKGLEKPLGEELLTPTRIYVKEIKALLKGGVDIHGMAHVTGGGFYENLPRMLPDGLGIDLDLKDLELPEIFSFLSKTARLDFDEMSHVFNMGVGFVLALDESEVEKALEILNGQGITAAVIGKVSDQAGVRIQW